jgi:hypothetical protein
MSEPDDPYGVTQPPISDELAERLLSGSYSDQDASSAAGLDVVLDALRAPAAPSELSRLDAALAAFQGAVVTPIAGPLTPRRTPPMRRKFLTAKAITTIGAVTLLSAGAAAAATGTVPSPFASDQAKEVTTARVPDVARENVGKHVSAPSTVTETTLAATVAPLGTDGATAGATLQDTGPDAIGPARYGLCTAYTAHVGHRDATEPDDAPTTSTDLPAPFRNLAAAATAAGQTVEDFCADATPGQAGQGPSATAPGQAGESPSATAPGQSGESPSATAPGQSGESPSATAPGQSGESPSATAPGQSGQGPSATAPGQSGESPSATAPASGGDDKPSATAPGRP